MGDITPKCRAVANHIIEQLNKFNIDITALNKKTLKEPRKMSIVILSRLLYICDIEYMKINNGKPLFEENFYAWPGGPVIPYLHYIFIPNQDGKIEPRYEGQELELTETELFIIDKIIEKAYEVGLIDLISITTINGGPWHKKYYDFGWQHIIPKKELYNFYINKDIEIQLQEAKVSTLVKKKNSLKEY